MNGSRLKPWALVVLTALMTSFGCSGGGSSPAVEPDATAQGDTGELIISITDAPGDFVSYEVTVRSLTLTRDNGDVVQTLPLDTRIDFAELAEVTEFLTIATVPAGTYTSATISVDFTDAQILVQDDAGNAVAARVQDTNGDPLDVVDMRLQLTSSDQIHIRAGIPAAFSLDFDLDASNTIDVGATPPVVTVEPFLLATPELETDREHRIRGVLAGVDLNANQFDLVVRPFRHRDGRFGEFSVNVADDTRYEVDGVGYTGASGLEAMSALTDRAPVVANGQINNNGLLAEVVLAGSSVPWSNADVVSGAVVARTDDTLTVRGANIEFADGHRSYRGEYSVQLSQSTTVTAPGVDNANLSIQSISVGQRIVVWGEQTDDRTIVADRVRMKFAQLTAEVVQADPLAVDLIWYNGRNPGIYDFAGTGITADNDADPGFYEIDTSTLPLNTLAEADLVRVRGLVNEFGAAPADFIARTLIDVQTDMRAATLWAGWPEGSAQPFVSTAPRRIDVDLSAARKALKLRGVPRGFITLLEQVALVASDSGRGVFAVQVRGAGEIHLYRNFEDLVDELVMQLDAGHLLHRITAQGRYNTNTAELTTGRAGFVFSTGTESG